MLFFRSEEDIREWCHERGMPLRPVVRLDQLWELAVAWYATRLQPDSHRPQPDEIRGIFTRAGLNDNFWDPQTDSFGN